MNIKKSKQISKINKNNLEKNIIIGAGISGLTVGNILKCPIIEKARNIGGLCRTYREEAVVSKEIDKSAIVDSQRQIQSGKHRKEILDSNIFLKLFGICFRRNDRKDVFMFDFTGHYLHIPNEYEKRIKQYINTDLIKIKKKAGIAINNRIIDYPFQSNFHNAGEDIKNECINDYLNRPKNLDVRNFEDWIMKYYGAGIGRYFMFPYNEKLWQYDLNEMTADFMGDFIPAFTDNDIIKGNKNTNSYNTYFYYPSNGGFDNILHNKCINNIHLNENVIKIDINKKTLLTDKENYQYDNLISTIPLKDLITMIYGKESKLDYTSVYNINLGIKGKCSVDYHWLYFPEKEVPFYRVGIPTNVNRKMSPNNAYSLSIEIAYKGNSQIDFKKIISELKKYNLIKSEKDIIIRKDIDIKYAYVIYNKRRNNIVKDYLNKLEKHNIFCTGRYSKWHYSFVSQDIMDAYKLAERIKTI